MQNKRNNIILFLCLASVLPLMARRQLPSLPSVYSESSCVVEEDGSVTFRYCGPAKRVYVVGDFLYADEDSTRYSDHGRKVRMQKLSNGCFYVTTRPMSPETYTYCFRVNGKRKPDPLNSDTAWQKMHKWNVVNVGGTPQADVYCQPERMGQLIRSSWYSVNEKLRRRVNIYLPAGYDSTENRTYPVLYLIHGINGYEGSWIERGRAIHILENMVAKGLCAPMIIVMPDVNEGVHEDRPSHHTLWNNIFNYPRLCHNHDIEKAMVELIQKIDSTYPVSDKHYIAGLSDGARIAANTVNLLLGYFEAMGMFSPVVHKSQLPKDSTMVFVYTGKRDMFHPNAKRFNKRLEKNKTAHCYQETIGGHTWRNWRMYLSDFLYQIALIAPNVPE